MNFLSFHKDRDETIRRISHSLGSITPEQKELIMSTVNDITDYIKDYSKNKSVNKSRTRSLIYAALNIIEEQIVSGDNYTLYNQIVDYLNLYMAKKNYINAEFRIPRKGTSRTTEQRAAKEAVEATTSLVRVVARENPQTPNSSAKRAAVGAANAAIIAAAAASAGAGEGNSATPRTAASSRNALMATLGSRATRPQGTRRLPSRKNLRENNDGAAGEGNSPNPIRRPVNPMLAAFGPQRSENENENASQRRPVNPMLAAFGQQRSENENENASQRRPVNPFAAALGAQGLSGLKLKKTGGPKSEEEKKREELAKKYPAHPLAAAALKQREEMEARAAERAAVAGTISSPAPLARGPRNEEVAAQENRNAASARAANIERQVRERKAARNAQNAPTENPIERMRRLNREKKEAARKAKEGV